MKERPILFSGPMVRAILDGRKAQTRRVIKQIPHKPVAHARVNHQGFVEWVDTDGVAYTGGKPCPYGVVGDRLWVRETWKPTGLLAGAKPSETRACGHFAYAADAEQRRRDQHIRWRSSIHMPRWASRITLEVTGVRVERLQDISEDDATAEGFEASYSWAGHAIMVEDGGTLWQGELNPTPLPKVGDMVGDMRVVHVQPTPRKLSTPARDFFVNTWRDIHGADSWSANPWVWVVEFRQL